MSKAFEEQHVWFGMYVQRFESFSFGFDRGDPPRIWTALHWAVSGCFEVFWEFVFEFDVRAGFEFVDKICEIGIWVRLGLDIRASITSRR